MKLGLFNFPYRYVDDVLSIKNAHLSDCLHHMYWPQLEIKERTVSASSASFLDLYLELGTTRQLSTRIVIKKG